jgi:hypothetical protein
MQPENWAAEGEVEERRKVVNGIINSVRLPLLSGDRLAKEGKESKKRDKNTIQQKNAREKGSRQQRSASVLRMARKLLCLLKTWGFHTTKLRRVLLMQKAFATKGRGTRDEIEDEGSHQKRV